MILKFLTSVVSKKESKVKVKERDEVRPVVLKDLKAVDVQQTDDRGAFTGVVHFIL